MDGPRQLRELMRDSSPVIIPEAYSALTARIAEMVGFHAIYCGGYSLGAMHLAIPDFGLIETMEIIKLAEQVVDAVSVPVICDADQGGETGLNVYRAIKAFERAGVAGVHIEDTINPKHVDGSGSLQSTSEMCARITAAVAARSNPDFVIVARSDVLHDNIEGGRGTIQDAIRRGAAYAEAGADVFMCSPMVPNEIREMEAGLSIPLLDLNHPIDVARESRLKFSVFTGFLVDASARLAYELYSELLEAGRLVEKSGNHSTLAGEFEEAIGITEYLERALKWRAAVTDDR